MKKCGDLTLREYFSGTLNLEILIQAIEEYKKLQKATVPIIDDLIAFIREVSVIMPSTTGTFKSALNNIFLFFMLWFFKFFMLAKFYT